ncbi:TIGR03086 family metal-binding protein [Rhodococcus spelaei]|uniref:TIGR03086 family metal-binding protein n=1 Tax=Rhodococcus spelaei TaxID=2546320 RepID=UPI001FEC7176|nr:TIGR03086 family metal-binding protein [Rhodococcus spelaei]
MLDLEPAARQMIRLLDGITDDQLSAPTPCEATTLGALVDHVAGFSAGFTAAANKNLGPGTAGPPSADGSRLPADWRQSIPVRVAALAEAWREPGAWTGMTQVGGVDLPGEAAGAFALDELVIHGWDIARASGQPFDCDGPAIVACADVVASTPDAVRDAGGLFGAVVAVPDGASPLDRLVGLTGRDPGWTPSSARP